MELAAAAAATEAQQIENNIERHFLDGLYSEEEVEELPSSPLETEPVRVYRGGGSTERMEDILRRHPATAPYSTREEVLAVTLRILFPRVHRPPLHQPSPWSRSTSLTQRTSSPNAPHADSRSLLLSWWPGRDPISRASRENYRTWAYVQSRY